ncbi:MAG: MFS transporter [Chloroflexi bacterium]|nr:MFS transporter [Chloroflexota bacterium]
MALALIWGAGLALVWSRSAWANGEHDHAPTEGASSGLVFLAVLLAAATIGYALWLYYRWRPRSALSQRLTRMSRSDYATRVRGFSRNAKLLVGRSALTGLQFGPWYLLFNLYLLGAGFDPAFVAKVTMANWLAHGLMVIPAGILSDLLGRRRVCLVFFALSLAFRVPRIFLLDPSLIVLFSALGGLAEGAHAVVGAPFMVEQSRPQERVHLFSISAVALATSLALGSALGGYLPLWLAVPLGVRGDSFVALRWSLMVSLPLALASMVPIFLIKEEWQVISLRRWYQGLTSRGTIAKLTLTQALEAVGLGLVVTFFNVYFSTRYGASSVFIGSMFSLTTVVTAVATLFTPLLVKRMGMVKGLVGIQLAGLPFLMLVAFSPNMWLAGAGYMFRATFTGASVGPGGGMGAPIEHLWPMEVVKPNERGTTSGLMHSFLEFPMALGAAIAGPMMVRGEWTQIYALAGIWFAASYLSYFLFFQPIETRLRAAAAQAPAGGTAS